MGLFTKKKSEVPELPPAPTLPELPRLSSSRGLPELPSFPGTSKNENLNREIVKSAVSDDSEESEEETEHDDFESLPTKPIETYPRRLVDLGEIPSFQKKLIQEPEPLALKQINSKKVQSIEPPMTRPSEPIFVRIDKFQSSQDSFQKILSKVSEIEKTLEKLKSVKQQEEEELAKWSAEVEQLKSRLSDIDDNIFSQL